MKTPSRHNIASIASFKRQVSFRFDYNSNFFYILKHLKFKLTEENQASVKFYSDVPSQLDSALVPNSIQKYRRGVQAAPNNHRSKRKVAAILRWFIYNHLGQISHTHTKHTRAHVHLSLKQTKKIKKVKDVKVKKKKRKARWIMVLKYFAIFSNNHRS